MAGGRKIDLCSAHHSVAAPARNDARLRHKERILLAKLGGTRIGRVVGEAVGQRLETVLEDIHPDLNVASSKRRQSVVEQQPSN